MNKKYCLILCEKDGPITRKVLTYFFHATNDLEAIKESNYRLFLGYKQGAFTYEPVKEF